MQNITHKKCYLTNLLHTQYHSWVLFSAMLIVEYIFLYLNDQNKNGCGVNGQFSCPEKKTISTKWDIVTTTSTFIFFFFSQQAALRGFLVILALSLHAVFEGIALGLTKTSNGAWFLFFAISCHKYVISFCIGMQFISSGKIEKIIILYQVNRRLISLVTFSRTLPQHLCVYLF